uniref:Cation/H+ exchanger transmembrane domain-containing protein n=1 Tax=Timema poppense TaxID=170557 RepID=A0A7R9GV40_TIMPO|nr:unnamed protein product [Timema poppensis]
MLVLTYSQLREDEKIAILAVPGFLIVAALTGTILMYAFRFDWSWEVWFLFGTIASATHPHYVVTILQDLGTIGSCWVSYGFVHGIKPGCGSGAREGQLPVALMLVYSVTDDLAGPMSILEVGPSMRRCSA